MVQKYDRRWVETNLERYKKEEPNKKSYKFISLLLFLLLLLLLL